MNTKIKKYISFAQMHCVVSEKQKNPHPPKSKVIGNSKGEGLLNSQNL